MRQTLWKAAGKSALFFLVSSFPAYAQNYPVVDTGQTNFSVIVR